MKVKSYKIYFLFIVLLIFGTAYFFKQNPNLLVSLKNIDPANIILLLALSAVLLFLNGYVIKLVTDPFGIELKDHFWLSSASSLLNLITPFRGGSVFQGWYLKKKYNLEIKNILLSLAGTYFVTYFINALIGVGLLMWWTLKSGKIVSVFGFFFFIFILICAFVLLLIPENKFKKFPRLQNIILNWNKIGRNKILLFQAGGLQLLFSIVSALILLIIFESIKNPITFTQALFISVFSIFSTLVNIVPGGIGITEAFFVTGGALINIPLEITFFASIILRVITVLNLFIWGIVGKFILVKNIENNVSG